MTSELAGIRYTLPITVQSVIVGSIEEVKPSIVTWQRLEPLPLSSDLAPALQAQIADPLWMLARQWQFAEFQGEDAGSPVTARLVGDNAQLSRFLPGDLRADNRPPAVDFAHAGLPLETLVEREPTLGTHPRLAAEAGEHLLRLLAGAGVSGVREALRTLELYPLEIADAALPAPEADPKGQAWQALFAGHPHGVQPHAPEPRTLSGHAGRSLLGV
jgi:hypothetical protein